MRTIPDLDTIRAAARRIEHHIHRTPVLTCEALDRLTGASLFFKCENFQKVGAFKFRGACNVVFSLDDESARRGVATHSSGNHAAALSLAARKRGIDAHIVMPRTAPPVKRAAVEGYGGRIVLCEPTLAARESTAREVVDRTGATFVHPYNDYGIIAGQATAALELLHDVPDLDMVLAPVGGGGLLSGTALTVAALAPSAPVVGGEPAGADDAFRSLRAGKIIPSIDPKTIADGLLTSLGDLTFPILRDHVSEIVVVDDAAIIDAMRLVWERMKIIIEPSAAVPLAAFRAIGKRVAAERVGIIFSGGNVQLEGLPWRNP